MTKKIYITESQFNELVENKKQLKHNKEKVAKAMIKADRKERRDSDKNYYGDGFKSHTRIGKSGKDYNRNGKGKFRASDIDLDDEY